MANIIERNWETLQFDMGHQRQLGFVMPKQPAIFHEHFIDHTPDWRIEPDMIGRYKPDKSNLEVPAYRTFGQMADGFDLKSRLYDDKNKVHFVIDASFLMVAPTKFFQYDENHADWAEFVFTPGVVGQIERSLDKMAEYRTFADNMGYGRFAEFFEKAKKVSIELHKRERIHISELVRKAYCQLPDGKKKGRSNMARGSIGLADQQQIGYGLRRLVDGLPSVILTNDIDILAPVKTAREELPNNALNPGLEAISTMDKLNRIFSC